MCYTRRRSLHHADASRSRIRVAHVTAQLLGQQLDIGVPTLMGEFGRVAKREIFQFIGQLIGFGKVRSLHPHGYDRDVALESVADLEADKVTWIIETTFPGLIFAVQPVFAYDPEQHVTLREDRVDRLSKVLPGIDSVDVHENIV